MAGANISAGFDAFADEDALQLLPLHDYHTISPALTADLPLPADIFASLFPPTSTTTTNLDLASFSSAPQYNSIPALSTFASSRATASTSSLSPHHSPSQDDPTVTTKKRKLNTQAAQRYRKRKVDRVADLEAALKAMTDERDEFKLKLARAEAEVDVLRRISGR